MASSHTATAQLHPLVFMSITDVITRHISRGLTTPLIGGLMGQQTRDGVTAEHTFDILLLPPSDGATWEMDSAFFESRLRQQQEVLKEPAQLEFVGFWTLSPSGAGIETHLQNELAKILPELVKENEAPMVLAFHADLLAEQMSGRKTGNDGDNSNSSDTAVARMPFTVYEAVQTDPQPSSMDADRGDKKGVTVPEHFREIAWEMQTGEAEMIALEFVRTGAGNATRVRTGATGTTAGAGSNNNNNAASSSSPADDQASDLTPGDDAHATRSRASKGQAGNVQKRTAGDLYTPEQEEMLSFLNTRANAMRTLLARLSVIRDYVAAANADPEAASPEIMRAIKALLGRLPGVEQAKKDQMESAAAKARKEARVAPSLSSLSSSSRNETQQQQHVATDPLTMDANLVELLGTLGRSLAGVRELGGKFHAVDSVRKEQRRGGGMMGGAMQGMMDSRYGEMDMMDLS